MHYLESLNSAQRRAVEYTEGPLLILAGAGAGKTKTLTHRMLHLIKKGIAPHHILAITFTNKAAKEMRDRIQRLLQEEGAFGGETPFVSTFHALGVFILRQEYQFHNRTKFFSIMDQKDSLSIIKEVTKELNLDPKVHEPKKTKHIISNQKNQCRTAEQFARDAQSHLGSIVASIWKKYEERLKAENAFDFDDLLTETLRIFEENTSVQEKYNTLWKYVHIDEYQDTNEVQYRISRAISKHRNLCVVGDGDQTIYTWRGANVSNILNFEKDYDDALVVVLEENYRSTARILSLANAVISKNNKRKEKNLFTKNKEGDHIVIYEALTDKREAEFVERTISSLLSDKVSPNDIAILYRANFQSRILEERMLYAGVPYVVLGTRFFDRSEVKDVLSYLRAAQNPDSLTDIKRVINTPKRGIGGVTIAKLFAGHKDQIAPKTRITVDGFFEILKEIKVFGESHLPSETVRFVIERSGLKKEYEQSKTEEDLSRIENMEELITFAMRYDGLLEEGIPKMLEDASLVSDQDTLEEGTEKKPKNGVRLMTVHASKGLEFKYVFIVGLEQDLFPHSFGGYEKSPNDDDEEERRLFYVAITRAEEQLFLSYAGMRYIHGEQHMQEPSEFLKDLPEDCIFWQHDEGGYGGQKKFDDYDSGGAFEYLIID